MSIKRHHVHEIDIEVDGLFSIPGFAHTRMSRKDMMRYAAYLNSRVKALDPAILDGASLRYSVSGYGEIPRKPRPVLRRVNDNTMALVVCERGDSCTGQRWHQVGAVAYCLDCHRKYRLLR